VSFCGKNSVHDKMTSSEICAKFGLPYGFDGPMHALGIHANSYNPKSCDLVHYGGTESMICEIEDFATHCIPLLKQQFHTECLVLQQALHSFYEVSPNYLGGNGGFCCLLMCCITLQTPVTMIHWILVLQ